MHDDAEWNQLEQRLGAALSARYPHIIGWFLEQPAIGSGSGRIALHFDYRKFEFGRCRKATAAIVINRLPSANGNLRWLVDGLETLSQSVLAIE